MLFSERPSTPPFGQADLSNCEREQIHLAGSVQPHGALLVVDGPDQVVMQASSNAPDYLNLDGGVVGRPLEELEGDLWARLQPHLDAPLETIPIAVRCRIGRPAASFDGLVHRPPCGALVIELERAGPPVDLGEHLEQAIETITASSSLRTLCDETAKVFKHLTGYDRVMVYRFDDEGHGEVFAEERAPGLESYLGNRYPASDIPQIARRLYERNRVRVLVDVDATSVPLTPARSPLTGQDLDMSLCFLRSMSPIHIQYLKNMGVAATLVVSLMVGGRLWGLVACHHYVPRFIHYEMRAVCELLAEMVATRIAALESFVQAQAELSVRRLEQRMIEAISRAGDWRSALFDSPMSLLQPLNGSGAALLFEGQILTIGDVPGTPEVRDIGAWLDDQQTSAMFVTASLATDAPVFKPLTPVASGLIAIPISSSPGEYLIWFRPERVRTVTWGGNPFKPVLVGNDPSDLSPRRSFSQWHQLVEGTSEPWTHADLAAASLIGSTVADIVLQFRAVRMLIVQDQLEQVSRQVRQSDQPVIVIDAGGGILLTNEAFRGLLSAVDHDLLRADDLPELFTEPAEFRKSLEALLTQQQAWRGEVMLETKLGDNRPLLVRADPVLASPDRVLGFVVLFTDLAERKAAEAARRRFQERIIKQHRGATERLDPNGEVAYRALLTSIVGNAQLAALEISDGVDVARMPDMLAGVRTSVTRTAALLEHLIWHAGRVRDPDA